MSMKSSVFKMPIRQGVITQTIGCMVSSTQRSLEYKVNPGNIHLLVLVKVLRYTVILEDCNIP